MSPRKKFKSSLPDEILEASVPLDSPALVLAAGPALWGMPAEILRLVRRCDTLSFQSEMPADTYGQIALEMTLEDLYNLSQTCKDMRVRLWCRSATFIWTDVIKAKAYGSCVPPLPPFLKVPEYIHFLLSSHCYVRPAMPCLSAQHLTSYFTSIELWGIWGRYLLPIHGSCMFCMLAKRVRRVSPFESSRRRANLMHRKCRTVWYGDAAKQIQSLSYDLSDAVLGHTTLSQYFIVLDPSE